MKCIPSPILTLMVLISFPPIPTHSLPLPPPRGLYLVQGGTFVFLRPGSLSSNLFSFVPLKFASLGLLCTSSISLQRSMV